MSLYYIFYAISMSVCGCVFMPMCEHKLIRMKKVIFFENILTITFINSINNLMLPQFFVDTDECEIETDNCHGDAICKNTDGSFSCKCNKGYQGNGTSCTG